MPVSRREPYFHRPEYFEPLRDLIQERLPRQAPGCLEVVGVTLWPIGFGDVEVRLQRDPAESTVGITTIETLYNNLAQARATLTKDCGLDIDTATIHGYDEQLTLIDAGPIVPITSGRLLQAEVDLAHCDTYTLRYFMMLLQST